VERGAKPGRGGLIGHRCGDKTWLDMAPRRQQRPLWSSSHLWGYAPQRLCGSYKTATLCGPQAICGGMHLQVGCDKGAHKTYPHNHMSSQDVYGTASIPREYCVNTARALTRPSRISLSVCLCHCVCTGWCVTGGGGWRDCVEQCAQVAASSQVSLPLQPLCLAVFERTS